MAPKKKWYKSKTIWINVVGAAALVVSEVVGGGVIPRNVGIIVLAALNGVVRFLTNEGIGA